MFDEAALLAEFAGDEEILKSACEIFLREVASLLAEVRAAADGRALELAAHKLKGAAANFRADPVVNGLHDLEMAARSGKSVAGLAAEVEGKVEALTAQLKAFVTGPLGHVA